MGVPNHANETLDALVDLHVRAKESAGSHQLRIERVAGFVGRPRTLYLLIASIVGWIGANLALGMAGLQAFDPPPFSILETFVSVAALLLTTMVLIAANRQSQTEQRRNVLDLQINLLAEQKIAKVIELIEALRQDTPSVPDRVDPEAQEMSEALDARAVAEVLERSIEDLSDD